MSLGLDASCLFLFPNSELRTPNCSHLFPSENRKPRISGVKATVMIPTRMIPREKEIRSPLQPIRAGTTPPPITNPKGTAKEMATFRVSAEPIRLMAVNPAGKKQTATMGWRNIQGINQNTGAAPSKMVKIPVVRRKTRRVFLLPGGPQTSRPLSGFYKRIKGRSGASIANKAAARKIAVYYYDLMTEGINFVEEGIKRYEERYKAQKLKYLFKQAQEFGFELVCA